MDLHKIDWENMPWEPVREGIERKAFSGAGATLTSEPLEFDGLARLVEFRAAESPQLL